MKFLLVLCILAPACSDVSQPDLRTPMSFRIEADSTHEELKKGLVRLFHRWGSGFFRNFTFSDSGDFVLKLSDSASVEDRPLTIRGTRLVYKIDTVAEAHSLAAYRDDKRVRVFCPHTVRPWLVFGLLDELSGEMAGRTRALLVSQRGQMVLKAWKEDGVWREDLNVFEERRRFNGQTRHDDGLVIFKGAPLPYDTARVRSVLQQYSPNMARPVVHVYPDYETKAQIVESVMEYSFDLDAGAIHLVHTSLMVDRFPEILSMFYACKAYGTKYPWLTEGLAMLRAGRFFGRGPDWWEKKKPLLYLVESEGLLEAKNDRQNPFLYTLAAMMFWTATTADPEEVFRTPARYIRPFNLRVPDLPVIRPGEAVPYFKGVCYAHTNGVESGYMSRASAASIEYLARMGVNTISVTPFGYARTDTSPEVHFVLDEMWDETLGGLFKAAEDAHRNGISVMMKPHLWLGNGKWCGEIDIRGGERLRRWERSYAEFIVYHALIAELSGMSSLCLGVELPRMTEHTELWQRIIRTVRVAFSGPITFGGNWNGEYERIEFWDDLDFIGVQQYYPLAADTVWTERSARARVLELRDHLEQFHRKWDKPVVFTEVGFPSIRDALLNPHREDFSQPASDDAQAAGYRILLEEFEDQPWFRGFFWWKFESDEESRRRRVKSFSFKGKEAERLVRQFYTSD